MKKPVIALLLATLCGVCLFGAPQGTITKFASFIATNGTTDVKSVSSTNTSAMKVTFIGLRSEGVSNSAAIYVGTSTNFTPYYIGPGERHIIETQPGTYINLKDWWLKTPTAADAMVVIYQ